MRTIFVILIALAGVLNAAPPSHHKLSVAHSEDLPMLAPLNIRVTVPEVLVPAVQEALIYDQYGTTGNKLVSVAKQYLGCRYLMGSRGPHTFDCSGLINWVYALEGIEIARSSREQYLEGIGVETCDLRPGDLVFFAHGRSASSIYHVGMVVDADGEGNYRYIHSSTRGVRVSRSDERSLACDYFGARRILADATDIATLLGEVETTDVVEVAE